MSFQDFQAGHHGGHLGSWNETNLAILSLHVIPCLPPNLGSIRLTIREQTWLKIFKMATVAAILDIGTNRSAILNLYVALMPPIKFQLNPTYGLGGDVIRRFIHVIPPGSRGRLPHLKHISRAPVRETESPAIAVFLSQFFHE